jgi:hypothetical protein
MLNIDGLAGRAFDNHALRFFFGKSLKLILE